MATSIRKLYTGCRPFKTALCAFCVLFWVAGCCWAGGSVWEILRTGAAVAVCFVLPGYALYRLARLDKLDFRLREPLILLLGAGFCAVVYCVCAYLQLPVLFYLLPCLFSILALFFLFTRRSQASGLMPALRDKPHLQLLAVLVCGLVFLSTFATVLKYARPSSAGDVLLSQDFLWMVGNAKSFQLAFPPIDIRFYNVRFQYHYLTEMLCGILGLFSKVDCYNILGFYLQPFLLAGLVVCLYRMGQFFYAKDRARSLLFTWAPFLFGCASLWAILPNGTSLFGNLSINHLLTNITSQATATLFLAIFCCLLFDAMERRFAIGPVSLILLICSFVMLTMAKGPVGLIAGLAAAISILFLLVRRQAGWQAVVFLLVGGGAFCVLYFMLFSAGTNGSISFSLWGTLQRSGFWPAAHLVKRDIGAFTLPLLWLAQLGLMAPAAFLPYLRGLWLDIRHLFTLSGPRLFVNGAAAGGLLAYFLFDHPNYSQVYFFLAALLFINLLAVDQLPALVSFFADRLRRRRIFAWAAAALAAVGLATAALLYVNIGGSGIRAFLRDVGVLEKYPYPTVVTKDDEAAGVWLAQHTEEDGTSGAWAGKNGSHTAQKTRFATNRIHSDTLHNDGISSVYTAFSGRQAFMEGYTYVADIAPWMWVDERKAVNDKLFDAATDAATLRTLCAEYGITHLIYSSQMAGSETQLAAAFPCVYRGDSVRIYEVTP